MKLTGKQIEKIVFGVICLVVIIMLINPINKKVEESKEQIEHCTLHCIEDTLDNFEDCIDLGYESTGFLSEEHYYLCDGEKVTNTCTKWDELPEDCRRVERKERRKLLEDKK